MLFFGVKYENTNTFRVKCETPFYTVIVIEDPCVLSTTRCAILVPPWLQQSVRILKRNPIWKCHIWSKGNFCLLLFTSCSSGSGGRMVERRTVNRGDSGSIPHTAVSKLRQFRSPHICLCVSEETLKAGGPFCLVSMPGEVKDPTQGVNV